MCEQCLFNIYYLYIRPVVNFTIELKLDLIRIPWIEIKVDGIETKFVGFKLKWHFLEFFLHFIQISREYYFSLVIL